MYIRSEKTVKTESGPHYRNEPFFVLEPSDSWFSLELITLWEYRELLYFLVWRDVKVRYKQTALGIAWAILQPLLAMLAFTLAFGVLGKIPSDGMPYPIFALAGLLPWQLFSNALSASSNSLLVNGRVIAKIYFPRLLLPLSAVAVSLIDLLCSLVVFAGMMIYYDIAPGIELIALPLFILLALVTALAAGLWLGTLMVQYRDIQIVVPFLIQFWLFMTPVAYPTSLVPAEWRLVYGLNPMVGVVDGFRWALLGQTPPSADAFIASCFVALLLFFSGLIYFKRLEYNIADML
jgi:lipopolysaccharide transport system permease protein